ncbi:unnamed protein product, partial [Prorocentrum cordatum]
MGVEGNVGVSIVSPNLAREIGQADSGQAVPTSADIKAQIAAAKRAITQSKPPSFHFASCSAALERAKARHLQAKLVLQDATKEVTAAEVAVASPEAECKKPQTQIATSSGRRAPPVVPQHIVDEAKSAMSTLYHNLVAVAAEAQKKSAEQASGPEAHSPPRKLIRSSSSPALSPARVPAGNGDDDSVFHEAPETK